MNIFKKEKTPRQEYRDSIKRQKGYKNEIAELSRTFFDEHCNKDRIDTLKTQIEGEEKLQKFLLTELKHPKPVPQSVDDHSVRVFAPKLGVKIGSDNTAEGKFIAYNKEDNSQKSRKQQHSSEPAEPTKKSNAKIIFFLVVFGLFLVGVAALSVYLSTCIGNKSAYSTAAAIFASTSE